MLATRRHACSISPRFASCAGRKCVLHVVAYQNGRVDVGSKYVAPDKFFQELRDGLAELDQRVPDKIWGDIVEQALNKEPFTELEIIKQVAETFEQEVTVYRTSNPGVRESVPRTELYRYCSSVEHFEGFLKQKLGISPQQEVELCWGVTEEPFAGQQFALQCPDDFPLPVLLTYADSWGVDDSM